MGRYAEAFQQSLTDPERFWGAAASGIDWYRQPTVVLDESNPPFYRWFADGTLNTCFNALDRHVNDGRGDQAALIYDSPVTGTSRKLTYRQLLDEVARFAGVLRSLGTGAGDRVVIYMPILDLAIELSAHKPGHCVILQRPQSAAAMTEGRDIDWQQAAAAAEPADCVPVAATDPLYILYTSGTTAKPKGVVRDNGGHAVALRWSMDNIYDTKPGEVFWAASDLGWVVGHSYIVYAPLLAGCTTVLYEGKPVGTPDPGAFWRVIAEHGVKAMFTAPTAFRAIKKEDPAGDFARKYDLSGLRYLFLAGERLDPETYRWAGELLGIPVIDHWWQTETGWPIAADLMGLDPLPTKPGSPSVPVPGYDLHIVDPVSGADVPPGTTGQIVLRLPLPPGCLTTLWGDDQRFIESYLVQYPGAYITGDGGFRDSDGYVYVMGRTDDVINVAGHRLSTGEMEVILASHPAVAECAVIGVNDSLKGQIPRGFVVLKAGIETAPDVLSAELVSLVRARIGAVAALRRIDVVAGLPKTRSGKILRKTMRGIAD